RSLLNGKEFISICLWSHPRELGFGNSSFFFQAEDGIRYKLVTGVQTCALPIFAPRCRLFPDPEATSWRRCACRSRSLAKCSCHRSEERRVGKECRSRWGPHNWKKQ